MATNNSGLNSNYLLVSEERRERERRERHRVRINRRASEEDSSGKCSICDLFTDSWSWQSFESSCDVFTCLFALDLHNEMEQLSTFFCYSWLACLLGSGWEMRRTTKRNRKSSFAKTMTLSKLTSLVGLCEKSSAILALVDGFPFCILTGKLE